MRLHLFLFLLVGLSACASPSTDLSSVKTARIGLINTLPEQARINYIGVTILENEFKAAALEWSFPGMIASTFEREAELRGSHVVDLSDLPEIKGRSGSWFETGYSLNFGLSEHKLSAETLTLLASVVSEQDLDMILLLRPADYNSSVSYDKRQPVGAFGLYETISLFGDNPIHTFVQIEARLIAGDPLTVVEDLNGSNLSRKTRIDKSLNVASPNFQAAIAAQSSQAVVEILGGLGL